MITLPEIEAIVSQISYKPGWKVLVSLDKTGCDRPYIQVAAATQDSTKPEDPTLVPWRSAKHYLSWHMCRQEVVSTAYHALERAEMHELQEWFKYRGVTIYNPHTDPDALVDMMTSRNTVNVRENAMSMEEK